MFGIILISVVALMQLYVLWRIWSLPSIRRRISGRRFIALGLLLWGLFLIGRIYGHHSQGPMALWSELFAMNWLGTLLLMTSSFLAADALTLFGLLLRRHVPMLRSLSFGIGIILTAAALTQGMRPPLIQNYQVRVADLRTELEGTRIAVLSDLHLGSLLGQKWLKACIDQTLQLKPDMVLLLGDIFEGHGTPDPGLLPELRRLTAPMGIWGILGNHEFHGDPDATATYMQEAGIHLLRNRWTELEPGLILSGVENPTFSRIEDKDGGSITQVLKGRPDGALILLTHAPRHYHSAAETGVDLMLSGHTHGGQIWPFGYLVQQVFRYHAGQHDINGMKLIISRGTGTWGPRMRLWRPSEILQITLLKKR